MREPEGMAAIDLGSSKISVLVSVATEDGRLESFEDAGNAVFERAYGLFHAGRQLLGRLAQAPFQRVGPRLLHRLGARLLRFFHLLQSSLHGPIRCGLRRGFDRLLRRLLHLRA